MAKKEVKELTPEEKLGQIIIPENEYEYQIPNNWRWIILGNLVSIKRGASPRPIKAFITTDDANGINWIKIGDSDSGKYITSTKEKITESGAKKSVFVAKGTLLLSNSMSFGRPYILAVDGCIHDGWLAITPGKVFEKEYLYYALLASEWYFERVAVGTAVRNLNSDRVAATPIPLPPASEQQRIVDRIESLFAKLDEAKEAAQTVVDGFEDRKAAILHKAFTGELTGEWRERNNVPLSTWETVIMQDVCEKITCGKTPKEHIQTEGEIPYLKVYNIVENEVAFESHPQFIPAIIHNGMLASSILKPKDVIMNIVGPPLRKIAIVPSTYEEWNMNQAIVRFRPKAKINSRFLYYSLLNPETLDGVINATRGVVGQANISVSQARNLNISLPCIEEQIVIVEILDMIMKQESVAKEVAETVITQIDTMKKSILARAFRGELGTNDPNDEPAVELLKRIL